MGRSRRLAAGWRPRRRRRRARERAHSNVPERARTGRNARNRPSAGADLPLGVLGGLAGSLEPVLLALLHPRVAGQESGLAEREAMAVGIELQERPGDPVADGSGLAGHATALDLDHRVEATLGAGDSEGHPDVGLVDGVPEVLEERAPVDDDLALAGQEADAGDGGLAPSRSRVEGRGGGPCWVLL